jgi:Fe-S oxidoreductase
LNTLSPAEGRRGEIYARLKALRDRFADEVRKRYPKIPRRVSGYNLDELLPENGFNVARALVGSESTCVVTLGAKLRLLDSPPHRALLVAAYPDVFLAGDHTALVRSYGCITLEGFQKHVIENMTRKGNAPEGTKLLPDGDAWLLAEFGGQTRNEAWEKAHEALRKLRSEGKGPRDMKVLEDRSEQEQIWHIRESGVGASRVPGVEEAWPSWEDAAVPPEVLGNYLRDFYKLLDKHEYKCTLYGHFGDGCIHSRITFDLKTTEGVRNFRKFMEEAADLVLNYGGSLSGEHGDGQARAELLPKMFGPDLVEAFREFKSIWDPHWRMNPGKVVDPYRLDTNLRSGPDYKPIHVETHFKFPEDHGSFAAASERCFGVGKCRGLHGGTMCPSFPATREEMHTTRGRAHLLFEMMRGDAIKDGWQDEHIHDALDLCLACKGCKADCPVSVDMATYKAEFLSHYYEAHPRPPSAYALGLIDVWARLGSVAPHIANLLTQTPVVSTLAKSFAGLAYQRPVPPFAAQTFQQWFRARRAAQSGRNRPQVLLWPDTFNNYFLPHTAQAAVEVLESLGYDVQVPAQTLCCGRALYDYGMLDRAKNYLVDLLHALRSQIVAGIPVVVLEPSCLAVFRDEMSNLMPEDELAQRMKSQAFHFSEFISRNGQPSLPKLRRAALVHGHCHQKAVGGMKGEEEVLNKMGLRAEMLDAGCCG